MKRPLDPVHRPGIDGTMAYMYQLEKYVDYLEEQLQIKTPKLHLSFWYMRDNHTFCHPKGDNIGDIMEDFVRIAKENPYGMVCPVIILDENDDEVRRVGPAAHVNREGDIDLTDWYEALIQDEDVVKLLKPDNTKKLPPELYDMDFFYGGDFL